MEILEAVGMVVVGAVSGAAGVAVAAYLGRSLLAQLFAKELETFKGEIQRDLEGVRNELRIQAHERETRFSRWHERQLLTLSELYARLERARRAHESLAHYTEDREVIAQRARDTYEPVQNLYDYFLENRIFIPDPIAVRVDQFVNELSEVWLALGHGFKEVGFYDRMAAIGKLMVRVPTLMGEIRAATRELLAGEARADRA